MEYTKKITEHLAERERKVVRTSLLGIAGNLLLVVFKATVGLLSNSIAILLDAVNNFSDALSSVITIIGTRLANRKPDKKHPYGHGRIEYLTGVLIAVIILLAGVTSLRESVVKIFHPDKTNYGVATIVVLVAAILAKLLMGRHMKTVGTKLNSGALVASGTDALFDSILTAGTLIAAIVKMIWRFPIEGIVGTLISVFIIKAGIELLTETLNGIIGTRFDKDLTEAFKEKVNSFPQVSGVYDVILHSYGPSQIIGSAHIEVPDEMTAKEIHRLTRSISAEIYADFGIILTVGVYASNENDPEIRAFKNKVERIVGSHHEILQMHGFYMEDNTVTFDLIVDFSADAEEVRNTVQDELMKLYPDYTYSIVLDTDYSD